MLLDLCKKVGAGGANTEEESSQFALSTPPARDRDTVSYPREAPDRMEAACPLPQASQSSRRLRAKFCSNEGDRAPLDGSGIERESGRPFSEPPVLGCSCQWVSPPKTNPGAEQSPSPQDKPYLVLHIGTQQRLCCFMRELDFPQMDLKK